MTHVQLNSRSLSRSLPRWIVISTIGLLAIGQEIGTAQQVADSQADLEYSTKPITIRRSQASSIDLSFDGKLLLIAYSGIRQGLIEVRSVATQEVLFDASVAKWSTAAVRFSPKSDLFAIVPDDKQVELWDVSKRARIASHDLGEFDSICIAFAPDGKSLAVGTTKGEVYILSVPRFERLALLNDDFRNKESEVTRFKYLTYSPDGKLLAGGGDGNGTRVWNTRDWKSVAFLRDKKGTQDLRGLGFSSDSRKLMLAGLIIAEPIRYFDTEKWIQVHHAKVPLGFMEVFFLPDGKRFLASTTEGQLVLVDGETGKPIRTVAPQSGRLLPEDFFGSLTCSSDGSVVAAARSSAVEIWTERRVEPAK